MLGNSLGSTIWHSILQPRNANDKQQALKASSAAREIRLPSSTSEGSFFNRLTVRATCSSLKKRTRASTTVVPAPAGSATPTLRKAYTACSRTHQFLSLRNNGSKVGKTCHL